jgi:NADH dehydrogenase
MTHSASSPLDTRHHVVVVGGGFAGLNCVKSLANDPKIKVTLVDRRNHHLFQPLLYQVATGTLSPSDVASPFRYVLRKQRNTQVFMGEVVGLDADAQRIDLTDGQLHYDSLVIATGSLHHYFGKDEWAEFAPGLKSLDDALHMREKILKAFEMAEREDDEAKRRAYLTFVIVGGGPTGVELAGSVAELVQRTLEGQFRRTQLSDFRIIVAEGSDRVLPVFSEALSVSAQKALESLHIEVLPKTLVIELSHEHAVLKDREGNQRRVETHTVLWGAGVGASPLGKIVAEKTASETDRMGRVMVTADFSTEKYSNIYVVGDLAHQTHGVKTGNPLPGVAPAATQGGIYVGEVLKAKVYGLAVPDFDYEDKGSMAIIGNNKAVASVKGLEFDGFVAWFLWLVIHVMFLVEHDNRVVVTFNWLVNYLTGKRSTRIITHNILPFFNKTDAP